MTRLMFALNLSHPFGAHVRVRAVASDADIHLADVARVHSGRLLLWLVGAPRRACAASRWMLIPPERTLGMESSTFEVQDGPDEVVESAVNLRRTERPRAARVPAHFVDGPKAATVLRPAGVRDGQPFAMGPDSSMTGVEPVLPGAGQLGVRRRTASLPTPDVMLFCTLLHTWRGGKSIWECDGVDLRAYKSVLLHNGDQQVWVGTW